MYFTSPSLDSSLFPSVPPFVKEWLRRIKVAADDADGGREAKETFEKVLFHIVLALWKLCNKVLILVWIETLLLAGWAGGREIR